MPRFIEYDNRRFIQVTERAAMRHAEPYRMEVLNWERPGGEVQYKCRPVTPKLYDSIKSMLEGIG